MLMVGLDYKQSLVKLTNIRVIVGGSPTSPTSQVDFGAEMVISPTSGKYNLESGWFFDGDFRKALKFYVFQVDNSQHYSILKQINLGDLSKAVYTMKDVLEYQVAVAPKLSAKQVESLGHVKSPNNDYLYNIPISLDKAFSVKPGSSTLAYILVPLLDLGQADVTFGTATWKETLREGKVAEEKEVFTLPPGRLARTSVDEGHYHLYSMDENGNGVAHATFPADLPPSAANFDEDSQHEHVVQLGKVKSAISVVTGKYHVHTLNDIKIEKKPNPGIIKKTELTTALEAPSLDAKTSLQEEVPVVQTKIGTVTEGVPLLGGLGQTNILKEKNKMAIFSEMTISQDENNVNMATFALDFNQIIKESTMFSSLSTLSALRSSFITNSRILSLKVYRTQVMDPKRPQDNEGNLGTKFLIAESHDDPTTGQLLTTKRYLDFEGNVAIPATPEEQKNLNYVGEIGEASVAYTNKGVRHFSVIDVDSSKISNGNYEYSAELQVTDPFHDSFTQMIKTLQKSDRNLRNYIELATPHYQKLQSRFKNSFVKAVKKETALTASLQEVVQSYLSILSDFTSISNISKESMVQMLMPDTATINTILEVADANRELGKFITAMISTHIAGESKQKAVEGMLETYGGQNKNKRRIEVGKRFNKNIFSRSTMSPKYFGYAFFHQQSNQPPGFNAMPQLTLTELGNRFDMEVTKTGQTPETEEISLFGKRVPISFVGELTPVRTLLGAPENRISNYSDQIQNLTTCVEITEINQEQKISPNQTIGNTRELASHLSRCSQQNDLYVMTEEDIKIATVTNSCTQILSQVDIIDNKTEMLEKGEDTYPIDTQIKQKAQDSTVGLPLLEKMFNGSFSTYRAMKNGDFLKAIRAMSSEELSKLPAHIIILAQKLAAPTSSPLSFSTLYQNYINLYTIEVFMGYKETSGGECSVISPIYKEMTSLSEVQPNSLCRIVPYESSALKINHEELLSLPLLGKYFRLGGE